MFVRSRSALLWLRDRMETLRIHSWRTQRMTCVISRNYAQPIPHHASPNSIVVWEIRFHGDKDRGQYHSLCLFGWASNDQLLQ